MLNSQQKKNITYLYGKFIESEARGNYAIWSEIDDYLAMLEYLDDDQIYRESEALYSIHRTKKMGCPRVHKDGSVCFAVNVLEAVEAITDLYKIENYLAPSNRYILCYYLALCQDGQIVELLEL